MSKNRDFEVEMVPEAKIWTILSFILFYFILSATITLEGNCKILAASMRDSESYLLTLEALWIDELKPGAEHQG